MQCKIVTSYRYRRQATNPHRYTRFFVISYPALLFFAWLVVNPVMADTLDMPTDIGAPPSVDIETPSRGMTMDEVEAQFGQPDSTKQAIGDPPITRWVYPRFTVHFERQYVIHTVVNK